MAESIIPASRPTYSEFNTLTDEIGIVVTGNKTAAGVVAPIGHYVILKNSTITGKTDGLYTAAKAIPAATAIDGTYLTAVSGGGLNALHNRIAYAEETTPEEHPHYIDINRSGFNYIIAGLTANANYGVCAYALNGSTFRIIVRNPDGSSATSPVKVTFLMMR